MRSIIPMRESTLAVLRREGQVIRRVEPVSWWRRLINWFRRQR